MRIHPDPLLCSWSWSGFELKQKRIRILIKNKIDSNLLYFQSGCTKMANRAAAAAAPGTTFLTGSQAAQILEKLKVIRLFQSPWAYKESVLRIRIRMDPLSFCCTGPGSVLEMRIRIQKLGNFPKITNKPGFLPSQKGFCTFVGMFLDLIYVIFHVKIQLLVTLKSK
jgi:hypothetical protein